ncbi:MAG: chloride channel protein [Gemmatimonadetes bacterium]|nr:chloride channel protein [Gemmatimonadota bacterium]
MSPSRHFRKEWIRARRNVDKATDRVWGLAREQHLRLLLLAAIVGMVAGLGAVGVKELIAGVQWLFWGSGADILESSLHVAHWRVLVLPAVGGLLVGPLVWFFARDASGHGVPEVVQALLMRGGIIRGRVAVVKAVASALTLGTGGSAGREGPMIQIGASLGSVIAQFTRLSENGVRTLVAAGAAGGLAAAFNAPIAGSLFALEVVLGDFAIASFSPVVMAGVTATAVSRAVYGEAQVFEIPRYTLTSPMEFLPYAVLGLLAGFVAVGFTLFLYGQEKAWEKMSLPPWVKPALGGLVVGALGLFFPEILGIGHMAMDRMLEGQLAMGLLLALVVMKIVATSLTLGSGGSGGVFVPSLFVGSALGGAVGTAVDRWAPFPHGGPGAYALVGMGAVVAAASHAPLTGIVIMFEMTGDYQIILPVMMACILATVVASSLKEESIYTQKLKFKGISMRQGREETILRHLEVESVLRKEYRSFAEDAPLATIFGEALGIPQTTFPVVDPEGSLAGVIRVQDLHRALDDRGPLESVLVAADLASPTSVLRKGDNVEQALELLTETGADLLPVVDSDEHLAGVVLAADVLERYSHELQKLRLASTLAQRRSFSIQTEGVELGHGMRLAEVDAPPALQGRTLREIQLRARFGVEVLYVLKGPYHIRKLADPDLAIEAGDRMVVMAEASSLRQFRESMDAHVQQTSAHA